MYGIATCNEDLLYDEFGVNAELIIDHSKGIETCLMEDIKKYKSKSKSLSNSQILPKAYKPEDARIVLDEMVQEGCYRLVRKELTTELIHLYIVYQDEMRTATKGTKRLTKATDLPSVIIPAALELYDSIVDKTKMVRKLGYDFADIKSDAEEQIDFFTDTVKAGREKKLVNTVMNIKDKYGKNAILRGLDLDKRATQKERNEQIGGHKSGEN